MYITVYTIDVTLLKKNELFPFCTSDNCGQGAQWVLQSLLEWRKTHPFFRWMLLLLRTWPVWVRHKSFFLKNFKKAISFFFFFFRSMNCIRKVLGSLHTAISLHWRASKAWDIPWWREGLGKGGKWGYRQGDYVYTGLLFFTQERRWRHVGLFVDTFFTGSHWCVCDQRWSPDLAFSSFLCETFKHSLPSFTLARL